MVACVTCLQDIQWYILAVNGVVDHALNDGRLLMFLAMYYK